MKIKDSLFVRFIWLICLINQATTIYADLLKTPGVAGVPFLKIGISARPASMAGAFVALSDDISSLEYNPAGLSEIKNYEIGITHVLWFEDVTLNNFLFGKKIFEDSAIGFNYQLLQAKDYERRIKIISEELSEIETGNEIKLNDTAISVGYAKKFDVGAYYENQVSVGVLLKYVKEELYKNSNSVFTGDVGLIYRTPNIHKSYGISIQNLGIEIGKDFLPITIRAGATHHGEGFNFSVDVIQHIDSKIKAGAGLEIIFSKVFSLRGGVIYQGNFNFTAGAGFNMKFISIDYAYLPHNELGEAHRMSLFVKF
ncbi:MAG: PorV/PorQ family protein [Endomicrobiia bacterium]